MESPPLQRWRHSLQKDLYQLAKKESDRPTTSSRHGALQPYPEDFQTVLKISSSFRDCGAHPTTYGKAPHFFLPETVMLWDRAIVRNTYKLRADPESFVSYQRFGWKLLYHVTRYKTVSALRGLEREHARTVGYYEPMTMILDHLAFSPKLSARAVVALGGPSKAFSDTFPQ